MTRVASIEMYHLRVPLRKRISHASHERESSDNFLVRAMLSDGTIGFGEGVPRSYVTGETIEGCFEAVGACDLSGLGMCDGDIAGWVERVEGVRSSLVAARGGPRGIGANAAWCALEMALLDAGGRREGISLGEMIRRVPWMEGWLTAAPSRVRYSGVITSHGARAERVSAWKQRLYGFGHVKVKVGVAGQDDAARLRAFRRILGRRVDIRLDANEAWGAGEVVERVARLRPFGPSVIEQPVPHAEVGRLGELTEALGVPVMLDESLCGPADAERAIDQKLAKYFNVRLSKCGGVLGALRLIETAYRAGLGVQLGCHPGETGVLSAAGRHVAANVAGLSYVEGSYDRHVLGANVIVEDITFGRGGWARPIEGAGLGVTVDPAKVAALSVRKEGRCYE